MPRPRMLALLVALTPSSAYAVDVVSGRPDSGPWEAVQVRVGGFVQPRFDIEQADDAAGVDGDIGFSVSQARFEFGGDLEGAAGSRLDAGWLLSVELMPEARLNDAYVDLGVAGVPVSVRLGQLKAPTGRAFLTSDKYSLFPELAEMVEWIPTRDIGAMLHSTLGRNHVEAELGVFNGEGTNRLSNVNRHFLYAGRLVISPLGGPGTGRELIRDNDRLPRFSLGGSVHRNVIGDVGLEEGALGLDGEFFLHWRWVNVQSEVIWRSVDYQDIAVSDYVQRGWYAQMGTFVAGVPWFQDHVALMGRVEQGDSLFAAGVPAAGPTDPTQASRSIAFGGGLYAGRPWYSDVSDLRLVVTYTLKEELEGFPIDDDRFDALVSMTF